MFKSDLDLLLTRSTYILKKSVLVKMCSGAILPFSPGYDITSTFHLLVDDGC